MIITFEDWRIDMRKVSAWKIETDPYSILLRMDNGEEYYFRHLSESDFGKLVEKLELKSNYNNMGLRITG